jgi:hypothetical protein
LRQNYLVVAFPIETAVHAGLFPRIKGLDPPICRRVVELERQITLLCSHRHHLVIDMREFHALHAIGARLSRLTKIAAACA